MIVTKRDLAVAIAVGAGESIEETFWTFARAKAGDERATIRVLLTVAAAAVAALAAKTIAAIRRGLTRAGKRSRGASRKSLEEGLRDLRESDTISDDLMDDLEELADDPRLQPRSDSERDVGTANRRGERERPQDQDGDRRRRRRERIPDSELDDYDPGSLNDTLSRQEIQTRIESKKGSRDKHKQTVARVAEDLDEEVIYIEREIPRRSRSDQPFTDLDVETRNSVIEVKTGKVVNDESSRLQAAKQRRVADDTWRRHIVVATHPEVTARDLRAIAGADNRSIVVRSSLQAKAADGMVRHGFSNSFIQAQVNPLR
jgi:hypothetical protein